MFSQTLSMIKINNHTCRYPRTLSRLLNPINIEETGSNLIILISDSGLIGQTFTLKLSAKHMTSSTASIEVSVESLI